MASARSAAGGGRMRIDARALDVRTGEKPPDLVAYAFGQSGKLLSRKDLKVGGDLSVPTTKEPESFRIVVGPDIPSDDPQEVLAALTRLDAPEVHIRSDGIQKAVEFAIDRAIWRCWLRFCVVRGTLVKRTTTGGLHVDLPVCGAEVEIYEVDRIPIILQRIPDSILDRIRALVRKPPPPPPEERFPGGIHFPPPPGPGPDPAPFLHALRSIVAEPPDGREASGTADEERVFAFQTGEPVVASEEEAAASLRALADVPEFVSAAAAGVAPFRSALIARPELVRPLLCWIWPSAVTTQRLATVTTDDCGHFRAIVFQGCSSDTPDLYFKAFRRIGGWRFPLLAPTPIACHTWWDYACGTDVTLVTTSPFAHTCPPCKPVIAPPHWVLAMAVGNTSLAAIRGTGTALQATTNPTNIGLSGPNSGWGDGAPFGGDLHLRFEFDNTLRTDLNVRYYRVRWRKVGSGNPYVDVTDVVWRHYAHMVGTTLMIEPFKLGPQPVGPTPNLYEIPPALPPVGQWVIADAVADTTSALFRSGSLAPAPGEEGLYEFELTLFDAAGNAVDATALGISYRIPETTDLTATITTANAASLGLVTGGGRLVYRLHIDNNHCTAAIDAPTLGGSSAGDVCGLLRYSSGTDGMTLPFTASHPHGFATYRFSVHRGAVYVDAVSTPTSLPVGPLPGTHVVSTTAGQLLNGCTIAGFAETLSVAARATNGWSRQVQYDRSAVRAFALAPQGA
jgi:hypothetical protein